MSNQRDPHRTADWRDVERVAMSFPEVHETSDRDGLRQWKVKDKLIVWERPLRRADFEALGESAPTGPILGARVPDLLAKEALLAEGGAYFTTPHFTGYPAILAQLSSLPVVDLEELVSEAWLARAPKRVVRQWLADHDRPEPD